MGRNGSKDGLSGGFKAIGRLLWIQKESRGLPEVLKFGFER